MTLTPREKTLVIALAKTAGSDKQLAVELGIGVGTLKVYVAKLRKKVKADGMDLGSRYRLITWAIGQVAEMEALNDNG